MGLETGLGFLFLMLFFILVLGIGVHAARSRLRMFEGVLRNTSNTIPRSSVENFEVIQFNSDNLFYKQETCAICMQE